MSSTRRLGPQALRTRCDPAQFDFETTDALPDLDEAIGQSRASAALRFGLGIRRPGFNLYLLGEPGIGRRELLERFLAEQAAAQPTPSDWCYVNNFADPQRPRLLRLPAGTGAKLRAQMAQLMDELRAAIPAAFESEEYQTRRKELEEEIKEQQAQAFEQLRAEAEKHGIALLQTPAGMAFAPVRAGEVISPDEFRQLPEEEQKRIETVIASLEERLEKILRQVPQWRRQGLQRIRELDREVTRAAVAHLIDELRREYAALPEVLDYLEAVQRDVIEHADDFRRSDETGEIGSPFGLLFSRPAPPSLRRFQVNVIVDHTATRGAPVVYEDNPSYQNLIGRVEHIAQMGALVTDFTLIKPGSLARANGGYLVLDAHKLLWQPFAWEALKRSLLARELRIESLGQTLSLVSTVSLEPEPIPLDVKVILIGDRLLYYLLYHFDPEFAQLFKVAADFEQSMARSPESQRLYARLIATVARREGLLPLDRAACARVVEEAARHAEDAERLSVHLEALRDLLREADHWARVGGGSVIRLADVEHALAARWQRAGRVRERLLEEIERGTILIDTRGARVGQVNGLSVVSLGDYTFGHPTRITARVRLGKGEVVDIQREVELAGPIHSKGVLTLAGFLGARYAPDVPLSLSASLVFEQTYAEVEGDSASLAELLALLSALAEVTLKQGLAVTGSVNQHGEVQAIGGVNEKIEGFFDLCVRRGLDGEQGVLIPAANVKHLMLKPEVVEAVSQGRFHIYAVTTIDEALELFTGLPAGERGEDGFFPEGSVNRMVEDRLLAMAEQARAFAAAPGPEIAAAGDTPL
jgi:lon-related putative ATP-dependent protease